MRLLRHGRWSRAVAALLLLASFGGVPHLDRSDQGCAPVIEDQHDESKHAIRTAISIDHDHCAICHWTRLPRSAFSSITSVHSPLAAGLTIEQRDLFLHRAPALDRVPARAPPVHL